MFRRSLKVRFFCHFSTSVTITAKIVDLKVRFDYNLVHTVIVELEDLVYKMPRPSSITASTNSDKIVLLM